MLAEKIHIAFAFDKNYITQCYVLLTSVFANNASYELEFHVIAPDISSDEQNTIVEFVHKNNSTIVFYDIDEKFVNSFIMHGAGYTHAIYYRLFFPHLLPESIERLLYIDSDTLVINDLKEFFFLKIDEYPVAAVTDADMPIRTDLGIDNARNYFNSGVLLFNLPIWRKQKITVKTIKIINEFPEQIKNYPDQDALNMALRNNWLVLECKYNLMKACVPADLSRREVKEYLKDKVIVHYNGLKPWSIYCEHKLRNLYHHYLKLSPKANESKYKKIVFDKTALQRLIFVRSLETYFNYPEVGRLWRGLKLRITK